MNDVTELGFLIELLLNHRLPKATREIVAARIKEVEASRRPSGNSAPLRGPAALQGQAPSTVAAMQRHPDLLQMAQETIDAAKSLTEPRTVAVVAQTPAAAMAMASRERAIAESIAGKVDKTLGKPRKF